MAGTPNITVISLSSSATVWSTSNCLMITTVPPHWMRGLA
jgi:hypothetical protein